MSSCESPGEVSTTKPKTAEGARDELTELVVQYQKSPDRALLEDIIHHPSFVSAYTYILRVCRKESEDVSQTFFVEIVSSIMHFNSYIGSFRTWALAIAKNVVAGWNRKKCKEKLTYTDLVDENSLRTEARALLILQVDETLDKIKNSDLLVKKHIEEMTGIEIADRLGINLDAANKRIQRAEAEFRKLSSGALDDNGDDDDR